MTQKINTSWTRFLTSSFGVSVAAVILSSFWQAHPIGLLLMQFFLGVAVGWRVRHHGWLAGIVVGVPLGFAQVTWLAMGEFGSLAGTLGQMDYWCLAAPAAVVSAGMAIVGSMLGAWVQDMKLQ